MSFSLIVALICFSILIISLVFVLVFYGLYMKSLKDVVYVLNPRDALKFSEMERDLIISNSKLIKYKKVNIKNTLKNAEFEGYSIEKLKKIKTADAVNFIEEDNFEIKVPISRLSRVNKVDFDKLVGDLSVRF